MVRSMMDDEDSKVIVLTFDVKVVLMMNIVHIACSVMKLLVLPTWGLVK